jgi:hypothetical protein
MTSDERPAVDASRRKFIRNAAYVAPVILTLKATPAFASVGSGRRVEDGDGGDDTIADKYPPWLLRLLQWLGWV